MSKSPSRSALDGRIHALFDRLTNLDTEETFLAFARDVTETLKEANEYEKGRPQGDTRLSIAAEDAATEFLNAVSHSPHRFKENLRQLTDPLRQTLRRPDTEFSNWEECCAHMRIDPAVRAFLRPRHFDDLLQTLRETHEAKVQLGMVLDETRKFFEKEAEEVFFPQEQTLRKQKPAPVQKIAETWNPWVQRYLECFGYLKVYPAALTRTSPLETQFSVWATPEVKMRLRDLVQATNFRPIDSF